MQILLKVLHCQYYEIWNINFRWYLKWACLHLYKPNLFLFLFCFLNKMIYYSTIVSEAVLLAGLLTQDVGSVSTCSSTLKRNTSIIFARKKQQRLPWAWEGSIKITVCSTMEEQPFFGGFTSKHALMLQNKLEFWCLNKAKGKTGLEGVTVTRSLVELFK